MIAWWRRSLSGQFIGLTLLALLIGQAIAFAVCWNALQSALRKSVFNEFISRTAILSDVIDTMPDEMRQDVLMASATAYARFWISETDPRTDAAAWHKVATGYLERPLSTIVPTETGALASAWAGNGLADDPSLTAWVSLTSPLWATARPANSLNFEDFDGMGLATPLKDGKWLNAAYYKQLTLDIWGAQSWLSILITAPVLSLIGVVSANRIGRPLRKLAKSAEALGLGEAISDIPEGGPDDIRQLSEAFNRMQGRLKRFVDDRTRMLAAIGHDLRTPLTTLRLRTEFVADEELQQRMLSTIEEMQTMTEAALSFAKGEATLEETRTVELNALIESLCDDLAEIGHAVNFIESESVDYRCRPEGLKRAVRNLIENALRYAGNASVRMTSGPSSVDILVEDHGPGIPQSEIEHVFAPFYRLEQSRSQETGGVGLGLSIARAIIRHHGGDIVLSPNNPGLRAAVNLPRH